VLYFWRIVVCFIVRFQFFDKFHIATNASTIGSEKWQVILHKGGVGSNQELTRTYDLRQFLADKAGKACFLGCEKRPPSLTM